MKLNLSCESDGYIRHLAGLHNLEEVSRYILLSLRRKSYIQAYKIQAGWFLILCVFEQVILDFPGPLGAGFRHFFHSAGASLTQLGLTLREVLANPINIKDHMSLVFKFSATRWPPLMSTFYPSTARP